MAAIFITILFFMVSGYALLIRILKADKYDTEIVFLETFITNAKLNNYNFNIILKEFADLTSNNLDEKRTLRAWYAFRLRFGEYFDNLSVKNETVKELEILSKKIAG